MTGPDRAIGTRCRSMGGLVLAVVLVAGCSAASTGPLHRVGSEPYERGSGTVTTDVRHVADFHAVVAGHGIQVEVETGEAASATVTADDNLLDAIATDVREGTLTVEVVGSIETTTPLTVSVTTSLVVDAVAATSGSTVNALGVSGPNLVVLAESAGAVTVEGTVDELRLTVGSGASAELGKLTATTARVELTAAATASVRVIDRVSGSCALGSALQVLGESPVVDVAADTSSSVVRGG